ncbi:MAG TPA: PAS domain-containing protein [Rectinemataceae bacterium]|nr:PAS domain-containing protein [Rectinemataceae bacterium]
MHLDGTSSEARNNPARTILLVEDQAIIALDEKRTLEGFGYSVLLAYDAKSALRVFGDRDDIELVLMDIDLGDGPGGPELALEMLLDRELPIVFLSAHSERETVERVRNITRYGYVIKQSGDFVLRSSIEMAFDLFAAHKAERRSAEALLERNSLLETILESFPGSVFWKDAGLVYRGCNRYEARSAGLAGPADIVGKTDYDLSWGQRSAELYRDSDRAVLESGRAMLHIEELVLPKEGEAIWLETSKVPLSDPGGRTIGVLGVSIDISERKRREKALLEMHALQNAVMDSSEDMIWSVEPDSFRLLSFNRSLAESVRTRRGLEIVRGMSPAELCGSPEPGRLWEGFYREALTGESLDRDGPEFGGPGLLRLRFTVLRRIDAVFGISVFAKHIEEPRRGDDGAVGSGFGR